MKDAPEQKMRMEPQTVGECDSESIEFRSRRVGLISAQTGAVAENGVEYELYYQMLESVRCPDDLMFKDSGYKVGKMCYSVMIIEYSGGVCGDSSFAYDVTDDKEKAFGIFRTLVKETVTPQTLFDVLEDVL